MLESEPRIHQTVTVLLIDDDDQVRTYCAQCLTSAGFRVLAADNGFEALLIAANNHGAIDLLITDVEMPRIRGPQLVQAFQALWPQTKVLFISGARDSAQGELDFGANFLQKPFPPHILVQTVDNSLINSISSTSAAV